MHPGSRPATFSKGDSTREVAIGEKRRDRAKKEKGVRRSDQATPRILKMSLVSSGQPPIDEPESEKLFLEGRSEEQWLEYVFAQARKAGVRDVLAINPEEIEKRIVEVYRLCFEQATNRKQMEVVRDFVAFHPHLALHSEWLISLLQRQTRFLDFNENSPRNRLLRAWADGWQRAANPGRIQRAVTLFSRLRVAREYRREMQATVKELMKEADRQDKAWISEQVKKLVGNAPRISASRSDIVDTLARAISIKQPPSLLRELSMSASGIYKENPA